MRSFKTVRRGAACACATILTAAGFAPGQENATEQATPTPVAPVVPAEPAAPVAAAPKAAESSQTRTVIVVQAVKGIVQYRGTPEGPWVKIGERDRLQEGITIRLGPNSNISMVIAGVQALTFDHAGRYIIRCALHDGETNVTRIKIPDQGRVTFNVNSTQAANDVHIEAPDMTLAIKGTIGGVEVTPGFATAAFGDIDNLGLIEVDYRDGRRVPLVFNDRSNSRTTDPAAQKNLAATVKTSGYRAKEDEEKEVIARSTGGDASVKISLDLKPTSSIFKSVPDMATFHPPGTIAAADSVLHIDSLTGDLFQTAVGLVSSRIAAGLDIDPQASRGGAALLTNLIDGSQSLVRLETTSPLPGIVKNLFSSLELDHPESGLHNIGKIAGAANVTPALDGLGAIRDHLYASSRSEIYRVDLSANAIVPVMSPGIALDGALAGSSERGSLFVFGREPGTESIPGSPFAHGVILELDPRTNYLAAAYSASNGAFSQTPGTVNLSRIDLEHTQAVTGMAYLNGVILMSAAVGGAASGQTVLVQYDPSASNTPGHPNIQRIVAAPESFTNGLASETTAHPRPSVPLDSPPGRIDTLTINALFARLAYSPQAFNSGVVERSVRAEVLRTARDPAGCAASSEIGNLRSLLASHVNQTAGVGRAVAEFRDSLPMMHPCMH